MWQVRNLGKPVALAGRYFEEGADEICFLNITGFRDFPLGDLPMLQASYLTDFPHYLDTTCTLVADASQSWGSAHV